jgi:hypothetical protein
MDTRYKKLYQVSTISWFTLGINQIHRSFTKGFSFLEQSTNKTQYQ